MLKEFLLSNSTKPPILSVLFITVIFIIFLTSLFLNRKNLIVFLKKINRKYWVLFSLILVLSLFLRIVYIPHHHKMYIDEPIYMEQAKIMITGEDYSQKTYTKSIGWPFIIKWFFITFGVTNWIALYLSSILGGLTVINVFLLAYILFRKEIVALWSSFLFALIPTHISWSVASENHMASVFFLSLSLWICCLCINKSNFKTLLLSLTSLAIAVQFRPENYLFIIPIFFLLIYKNKNYLREKNIVLILIFMILITPNFARVYSFQVVENHNIENVESDWNEIFLSKNSKELFNNILLNYSHPFILSIFLLLGLYFSFYHAKKRIYLFLVISSIISIVWIIPYHHFNSRYLINFYLLISIYGGLGLFYACKNAKNYFNSRTFRRISIMITVLILLSFYPYISKINNLWLAHALETKIPELAEKEIPKECIIITEWPIIFSSTTDIQVIRIQKFLDENIFDPEKCFLFFEDFLCDGTYASDPNCKRILNEYETIPFISYNVSKERNHEFSMKKYSFHKLKRKY